MTTNSENNDHQIFRDISNFKTPKSKPPSSSRAFQSSTMITTPQFFTASKQTPSFSLSTAKRRQSKSAVRRLKAFELEQSQSCRKEEIKKERSMKSLAKSLTVWLNFLLENPSSCGCDQERLVAGFRVSRGGDDFETSNKAVAKGKGKRESVNGGGRLPKRLREVEEEVVAVNEVDFSRSKKFVHLRNSMKEVCSLDDLVDRMRGYLSLDCCMEVFNVMTQVTKNIDEGRLKMKAHCPIVTDVGMRENAIKVLMCYNPVWLRIGLYIIFGGESLLPDEDSSSEQDISFMKMVIEKQLLAHASLAKAYAYNRRVDGLYRPGYFEMLGNIILKRFLLLVLILDRGKIQSSLPLKYGIDGLDGGSPLLFNVKSNVKSSRQMINDFLSSDVMHGEGNLLAHLAIVGYKVSYQQVPLVEYDLRITDLFQDLQDGVRLCRAIHLLQNESSILAKLVLPADTQKKKITNCGIALDYLKHAGVSLDDGDGMIIVGEDIAGGDKELILTLLWNMFVHLQVPLLISKSALSEEISNISKAQTKFMAIDTSNGTHLDMLLNWVKAICKNYDIEVESLVSLVDGKVMWCLLDLYFRKEDCSCSIKELNDPNNESIVSMQDVTDAVHNFGLSQKLATLMGNFPEVLQLCEILEYNGACNEKSVIILLVFLCSELLVKTRKDQLNFHKLIGCSCQNPDRKWRSMSSETECNRERKQSDKDAANNFKAVQAWWQEMAKQNSISSSGAAATLPLPANKCSSKVCKVNAAIVIQSHIRGIINRKKYLEMKQAVSFLQLHIKSWLIEKKTLECRKISASIIQEKCEPDQPVNRHRYVDQKSAATLIQKAARTWISKRRQKRELLQTDEICDNVIDCSTQKSRQMGNICSAKPEDDPRIKAAVKIQSHFRGWVLHRRFQSQIQAALDIQSIIRSLRSMKDFDVYKVAKKSAMVIQSHARGWHVRKGASHRRKSIVVIQSHCRCWMARRHFLCQKEVATMIQSHCRCWMARRHFLRQKEAAIVIQRAFRVLISQQAFQSSRHAATEIQRVVRGRLTRAKLLGASSLRVTASESTLLTVGYRTHSSELKIVVHAIMNLQRWWKSVLTRKSREAAVVIIQSYIRGYLCRCRAAKEEQHALIIQAHWKGYLARKHAKAQLVDLRLRIQKSAATVEDGMRIMNRLIAALKELKSMKNVSGILHNCATLNLATTHSQKCCERLVDEGAIGILLYQIRAVTRSIPDQEVLKHCLSTLRNLARYAHLADVLISHEGSVEIILRELLRNKEEGYFIACELLKRLCTRSRGIEAVHSLPSMLKRLHLLVEDLTRKTFLEKRNHRGAAARDTTERRLKEATELWNLITQD
ncbi:hypothetical protein RND81_10G011800 [Saponaria officinalis]|uniref:Calponin-homology (CH) domain-containing protein n=1 Tax=Saponaria officinalis TaxID=3572 RepID=A0AAW1HX83_SAPOF